MLLTFVTSSGSQPTLPGSSEVHASASPSAPPSSPHWHPFLWSASAPLASISWLGVSILTSLHPRTTFHEVASPTLTLEMHYKRLKVQKLTRTYRIPRCLQQSKCTWWALDKNLCSAHKQEWQPSREPVTDGAFRLSISTAPLFHPSRCPQEEAHVCSVLFCALTWRADTDFTAERCSWCRKGPMLGSHTSRSQEHGFQALGSTRASGSQEATLSFRSPYT